jgi:hypothetical protein
MRHGPQGVVVLRQRRPRAGRGEPLVAGHRLQAARARPRGLPGRRDPGHALLAARSVPRAHAPRLGAHPGPTRPGRDGSALGARYDAARARRGRARPDGRKSPAARRRGGSSASASSRTGLHPAPTSRPKRAGRDGAPVPGRAPPRPFRCSTRSPRAHLLGASSIRGRCEDNNKGRRPTKYQPKSSSGLQAGTLQPWER